MHEHERPGGAEIVTLCNGFDRRDVRLVCPSQLFEDMRDAFPSKCLLDEFAAVGLDLEDLLPGLLERLRSSLREFVDTVGFDV